MIVNPNAHLVKLARITLKWDEEIDTYTEGVVRLEERTYRGIDRWNLVIRAQVWDFFEEGILGLN